MRPSADAKQVIGRVCYHEATSVAPSADAKQAIGRACYLEATSVAPSLRLTEVVACVCAGGRYSVFVCVRADGRCVSVHSNAGNSRQSGSGVPLSRVAVDTGETISFRCSSAQAPSAVPWESRASPVRLWGSDVSCSSQRSRDKLLPLFLGPSS